MLGLKSIRNRSSYYVIPRAHPRGMLVRHRHVAAALNKTREQNQNKNDSLIQSTICDRANVISPQFIAFGVQFKDGRSLARSSLNFDLHRASVQSSNKVSETAIVLPGAASPSTTCTCASSAHTAIVSYDTLVKSAFPKESCSQRHTHPTNSCVRPRPQKAMPTHGHRCHPRWVWKTNPTPCSGPKFHVESKIWDR